MTSPSEPEVTQVQEAPVLAQALLTLTEIPDTIGGFTIGLALASHANPEGEEVFRIPVVDIILLAVVNTLKNLPKEFQAEIDAVNTAISDLGTALASGEDAEAAIANFNTKVGVPAYVRRA